MSERVCMFKQVHFPPPSLSPQENGCSSQQMDDLFDILIEHGGKRSINH